MIEIDTPQTFGGILLAAVVIFVAVSALITTGLLPVLVALAAAAVAAYLLYIVLMRIHRLFMQGGLRSGRRSS